MTTSSRIDLEPALRARLPNLAIAAETPKYVIDGLTPSLVVSPATADEVAAVLALANEAGAAAAPFGAGTQIDIGMPPEHYDLALDLRGLSRVVEYEPADLTVTVEAGISISELQQRLAAGGQWLPLDPFVDPTATIGGLLATNASGPARHSRGTLRDLLIGIRIATPAGDLLNAGGRVVKNVAGYDLGKLHIGALGTLGVIVQASFKIAPLAASTCVLSASGSLDKVMSTTSRLAAAGLATESMVLHAQAAATDATLTVRFAGGAAAVDRSRRDFADLAAGLSISEPVAVTARSEIAQQLVGAVVAKASVLPAAVPELWQKLAASGAAIVCYPSAGILYGAWSSLSAADLQSLRRSCVDAGQGALVLEKAPDDLKRAAGVWGEPRGDFTLMQRLKQEFDANRVLNPGRYLGGL